MAVPGERTEADVGVLAEGPLTAGLGAADSALAPGDQEAATVGIGRLLYEEPYRFGFFQAVRLLKRLAPTRQPVGRDAAPLAEAARFRAHLGLHFPPSEIYDLEPPGEDGRPPRLTAAFIGLYGPSGTLPRHYTEMMLERARHKDHTLRSFLDLFNHRLISLFYRAWEKYRFWLGYEQAEVLGQQARERGPQSQRAFVTEGRRRSDLLSQCLLDLAGLGEGTLRYRGSAKHELVPRHEVADETLRHYAGLLAQRHRSAAALETMLEDYFEVPVRVIQFSGQWLMLDEENQTCLGRPGGNVRLGLDTVAGQRVWDVSSKFRVMLGPLDHRQFTEFLPSGKAHRPLVDMVRLYAGAQFDFDMQLVLKREEVPACTLGGGEGGVRLGWETWPRAKEMERDVGDAVVGGG
jgi:type VI secretion system protein ImpH